MHRVMQVAHDIVNLNLIIVILEFKQGFGGWEPELGTLRERQLRLATQDML